MLRFDAVCGSMAWANRTLEKTLRSLKQGGGCMSAPKKVDDAPKPSSIHDDDDGFVYPSCGPTIFSLLPTAKMPNIQNLVASCAKHASTAVRKVKKARTRSVAKEHLPDADVDFVVMNASPLVLDAVHTNNGTESVAVPVQDLDFAGERKMLLESRAFAGSPSRMCFRHLSAESLSDVLAVLTPKLLHLSGHGDFTRNGEYIMAFESRGGSADLITMDRLKCLVAPISDMPELIVLGVCYSENAARIFVDAGARHVVACKSNTRVMDDSARHFSRNFYLSLFRGHSIKRAFDFATAAVHVAIDSTMPDEHRCGKHPNHKHDESCLTPESTKFILLPEEGVDHNVSLFEGVCEFRELFKRLDIGQDPPQIDDDFDLNDPLSVDPPSSASPPKPHLPSQHEHMVGRRAEIHQVVSQLQSHRIVNVYGPRKYGKTLVTMAACHYMKERRRFRHGVFWISMSEMRVKLARLMEVQDGGQHAAANHESSGYLYPAVFDDDTSPPPQAPYREHTHRSSAQHSIQNPEMDASASGTGLSLAASGDTDLANASPRRVPSLDRSAQTRVLEDGTVVRGRSPLLDLLCAALGLDPRNVDSIPHFLRIIHNWECLIVLDDGTTGLASDMVRLLLRHTRHARVVVTCVQPFRVAVELGFVPAQVLVKELPIHDALNLVHQIAPRLRTDEAVQLVRKCRSPYLLRLALLNLVNCTSKSKAGSVGCLDDHGALVDPPTPPSGVAVAAGAASASVSMSRRRRGAAGETSDSGVVPMPSPSRTRNSAHRSPNVGSRRSNSGSPTVGRGRLHATQHTRAAPTNGASHSRHSSGSGSTVHVYTGASVTQNGNATRAASHQRAAHHPHSPARTHHTHSPARSSGTQSAPPGANVGASSVHSARVGRIARVNPCSSPHVHPVPSAASETHSQQRHVLP